MSIGIHLQMLKLIMLMIGDRYQVEAFKDATSLQSYFQCIMFEVFKTSNLERWNTCSTSSKIDAAEGDVWNTYTHGSCVVHVIHASPLLSPTHHLLHLKG